MTGHWEPARFKPGDTVTLKVTGKPAKVVAYLPADEGRWRVIVDQPHGNGVMRRTFEEDDLQ